MYMVQARLHAELQLHRGARGILRNLVRRPRYGDACGSLVRRRRSIECRVPTEKPEVFPGAFVILSISSALPRPP